MEKSEPLLDGEYSYSFTSASGNEVNPEREIEEEFAIFRFTGEISELPEHFKRNVTIQRSEQFEEGDVLVLRDGHVSIENHDLEEIHVTANDDRQKIDIDLNEIGENALYCSFCGKQIWSAGQKQEFISCQECGVYYDVYGKGEQIVLEAGP